MPRLDRRRFLTLSLGAAAATRLPAADLPATKPLRSPHYNQVTVSSERHLAQQRNAQAILMGLSDDSLLKPFRAMAAQPAPGVDIGGWYQYLPTYDYQHGDAGFAPGHCFGQWTSALARLASASNNQVIAARVRNLHAQLAATISPAFFDAHRFPAYTFDKLVCDLMDAHALLHDPQAFPTLDKVHQAALPSLPGHAMERDIPWRANRDKSFFWDENYILPENLYLISAMGAGLAYRTMADQYLLNTFFDPLARNENVLGGLHAYSHVNALCSAMQAWFVAGSNRHLQAAVNGFAMLEAQSYSTGGWAPEETLEKPGSDRLFTSLTKTHNSFETPCGAYAHMKLTRYLLQATHRWPCCSGTLPQLAADYGINAYLLGPAARSSVWVNLYFASTLRWIEHGTRFELEQAAGYPETDTVRLHLRASRSASFTLRLRIPEWTHNPQIAINGQPQPLTITRGFAELQRHWQNGDVVELHLPMQLRLDPLHTDSGTPHPEIASLVFGPRVLMAMAPVPALSRDQLLAARRISPSEWVVDTPQSTISFKPFTEAGDDLYSAHVHLV